jgi:hypothetical protein
VDRCKAAGAVCAPRCWYACAALLGAAAACVREVVYQPRLLLSPTFLYRALPFCCGPVLQPGAGECPDSSNDAALYQPFKSGAKRLYARPVRVRPRYVG